MSDVTTELAMEASDKAIEIARLKAENDKLREQVSSLVGRSFRTADKMSCIEADNAKLRELVRDMWRDGMCECDERGACAQCEYHFLERMRDLGVEVDE